MDDAVLAVCKWLESTSWAGAIEFVLWISVVSAAVGFLVTNVS